jgi:hypothetical protein
MNFNIMLEYQFDMLIKVFAGICYSVALWLCFRIRYWDLFQKKGAKNQPYNIVPPSISTEVLRIESLQKENGQLKNEIERLKTEYEQLAANHEERKIKLGKWTKYAQKLETGNNQLTENVETLKLQNDTLFETLRGLNIANFEVETYISDGIVLLTGFRQRILPGSSVNKFHCQLSIGLKFIINH